ncbi:MAG: TlpA family protein disulfide reductase [Bacteroidota bacterium]|jgi:thiol-disulfide isomerase/thioredoxin|nr:TlpA family protein disulfide reductase [Bacteroidota bacterium]
MLTRKKINKLALLILIFLSFGTLDAQNISVYKIDDLMKRVHNNSDTVYVVNFWATWCKPCVTELPDFEKLHKEYGRKKVKVLLVSMDFKEELSKKLKSFLEKNKFSAEIILLDEVNGNDFINQISTEWSGAIPATLFTRNNKQWTRFHEGKITYDLLTKMIE